MLNIREVQVYMRILVGAISLISSICCCAPLANYIHVVAL